MFVVHGQLLVPTNATSAKQTNPFAEKGAKKRVEVDKNDIMGA
jgi:hypothetical protein